MRIIGCDPGASGAIALLDTDTGNVKMFDTPTGKVKGKTVIVDSIFANNFSNLLPADVCVIEEVSSMPRDGVSSAFKFGTAYGIIRGITAANSIQTRFATPSKWKTAMRLVGQEKDASRVLALQLYPKFQHLMNLKKHHGRAEALLIAHAYAEGLLR